MFCETLKNYNLTKTG